MKLIFLFLAIYALSSCSSLIHPKISNVAGIYTETGEYGIGSTIRLNDDKTFEYHWWAGLRGGTTKGTWKIHGNKITLNSEWQPFPGGANYQVTRILKGPSDSLTIRVVDTSNMPFPTLTCALLKTDTTYIAGAQINFKGEIRFPKISADSLIIKFLNQTYISYPLDKEAYRYEFQVMPDSYTYFSDFIIMFNNKNMYFSKWKCIYYKINKT